MKSSTDEVLIGSQEPTYCIYPEYETSGILDCIDINVAGGLDMFDWQTNVVEPWIGKNAYGRWSAQVCGLMVPRQNGKTMGCCGARINYGMLMLGETIIYTAHLQKTATETFELLRNFYERNPIKKRVKAIRSALGREEIQLKNGARIKFLARTRNGGRGQHGDLLIYDEAQELTATQQSSFRPAISASPNPQTIYMGTPPEPDSLARVFYNIRKRAKAKQSKKTAWSEWAVDEIPEDLGNKEIWAMTNPSLGKLIQLDTIEGELEDMEPEEFAKERLCYWNMDEFGDGVISKDDWDECLTNEPPAPQKGEKMAVGIKFTADGSMVALSAAVKQGDRVYVEALDYTAMNRGVTWLSDWIIERKNKIAMVYIDGKSNTGSLVAKLNAAKYPRKGFRVMTAGDVIQSSSMFANAVMEHDLEHSDQSLLNESVCYATKRPIGGDGGWGFGNGKVDCAPAEATAFAYAAVMTTKRNPNRELRVG